MSISISSKPKHICLNVYCIPLNCSIKKFLCSPTILCGEMFAVYCYFKICNTLLSAIVTTVQLILKPVPLAYLKIWPFDQQFPFCLSLFLVSLW